MENDDPKFMALALDEARKSRQEDDRTHPRVGVVVVRDGQVIASAHRGEVGAGEHAEYTALEKKLSTNTVVGATIYTTLEPCTTRNHPKVPCAHRLVERKIRRVVVGMLDPNRAICGRGLWSLRESNVATDLFPHALMCEVEELNRDFIRTHRGLSRFGSEPPTTGVSTDARTSSAENPLVPAPPDEKADMLSWLFAALEKKDAIAADVAYQKILATSTSDEQRARWEVAYLDLKFKAFSDSADRARLEEISNGDGAAPLAAGVLGDLALLALDLPLAAEKFQLARTKAVTADDIVSFAIKHANVLQKSGKSAGARAVLKEGLVAAATPTGRSDLVVAFADMMDVKLDGGPRAALLTRAAQLSPTRVDTRFKSAYALAEARFGHAALLNYSANLKLGPDSSVSNNLAVQCAELNMPMIANKYYKQASDAGNTLASSNLARGFLNAGFVDEAEQVLGKARLAPDVHPNVGATLVALHDKRKEEDETWGKVAEMGQREQAFVIEFAEAVVSSDLATDFAGTWQTPAGETVKVELKAGSYCGAWGVGAERKRIAFSANGTSALEKWEPYRENFGKPTQGIAYVAEKASLRIIWVDPQSPSFETWARKDQ